MTTCMRVVSSFATYICCSFRKALCCAADSRLLWNSNMHLPDFSLLSVPNSAYLTRSRHHEPGPKTCHPELPSRTRKYHKRWPQRRYLSRFYGTFLSHTTDGELICYAMKMHSCFVYTSLSTGTPWYKCSLWISHCLIRYHASLKQISYVALHEEIQRFAESR